MDSYPPHLLRLPGSAPDSPRRGDLEQPVQLTERPAVPAPPEPDGGQQDAPPVLLATPGQPGAYEPPVSPGVRPRNITDLGARVTPASPEPWPAGAYVPVGERGKRGHWTGSSWKSGESPGYGGQVAAVRSEPEQTTGDVEQ